MDQDKKSKIDGQHDETDLTGTSSLKGTKDDAVKNHGEIIFVKYWRVGDINIDLSIAGFGGLVNLSNQAVDVPFFQRA